MSLVQEGYGAAGGTTARMTQVGVMFVGDDELRLRIHSMNEINCEENTAQMNKKNG